MKALAIRPRCRLSTVLTVEEVMEAILTQLKSSDQVTGSTLLNHAYLKIPVSEQHYWSPELHVTVEKGPSGTIVRGVVGPKPKIWTMFMFFYAGVVVLFLFGSVLGISQWMLGMDAPWLWSIPAAAVLWLLIFVSAKIGQQKGYQQMVRLRGFLDDALEEAEKQKAA